MPIRFRCAYCNQLMGIARRKAGTVVACPKCQGQVVVPIPPPDNGQQPEAAETEDKDNLFEKEDFGKFLNPGTGGPLGGPGAPAVQTAPDPAAAPQRQAPTAPAPAASPPAPYPAPAAWPDTLLPPERSQPGLFLTPGLLTLLGVLVLLLLGLAFFVGLLLGKASVAS